jgi:RNA polymerase sigma factor (sigma-70 family)
MMHNQAISIELSMTQHQEETFKNEKGRLLNFIKSRVNNLEDAEDILQDVFLQFVNGYGAIGTIENATAWMFRVARNKIVDLYRKQKVRGSQTDTVVNGDNQEPLMLTEMLPELGQSPEDTYFRELIWEGIMKSLDELPKEQRDVFVMHELEDKSFKEIAKIEGAAVNTLISRKRYAVLSLRKKLINLYEDI